MFIIVTALICPKVQTMPTPEFSTPLIPDINYCFRLSLQCLDTIG